VCLYSYRCSSRKELKLTQRTRILLADDQPDILCEAKALLAEHEIVGAVENGQILVETATQLKPDLIITDISMPVMTGFEAAAKIRELGLASKLIFLTVQSAAAYVRRARFLGADGYVLKTYATEQLREAVTAVLTGHTYISPQLKANSWT
jgi:DNA-binding NarL/FixJ family response regulator